MHAFLDLINFVDFQTDLSYIVCKLAFCFFDVHQVALFITSYTTHNSTVLFLQIFSRFPCHLRMLFLSFELRLQCLELIIDCTNFALGTDINLLDIGLVVVDACLQVIHLYTILRENLELKFDFFRLSVDFILRTLDRSQRCQRVLNPKINQK